MEDYEGFIFGEDVDIDGDSVYCLASWHRNGGDTPGALYRYDLTSGKTEKIYMGDIMIPRSLTWDAQKGLFVNVVPYFTNDWNDEYNCEVYYNYGGGVYHLESDRLTCIFEDESGVFNSAFAPDGTLYIASLSGTVYALQNGTAEVFAENLFPLLKNISILGEDTMYLTTLGGTFRMKLQ